MARAIHGEVGFFYYLRASLGLTGKRSKKGTHAVFQLRRGGGYLLPVEKGRIFRRSFALYQAQSFKGKLAVFLMSSSSRMGLKVPFLPRIEFESESSRDSILQAIKGILDESELVFAVSLGAPGPHRKPVVQVMTTTSEVLGYAKVGWNDAVDPLVRNESRTLEVLGAWNLPLLVPKLLYAGCLNDRVLCLQAAPPKGSRGAPRILTSEYIEVFCALAAHGLSQTSLEDAGFWNNVSRRVRKMKDSAQRDLMSRALQAARKQWHDRRVSSHFAHGDLTPWNVLETDTGLFLLDWEYANESCPAGYDLFHFLVQTAWLVKGLTPGKLVQDVLKRACAPDVLKYWERTGMSISDVPRLLQLYFLDRMSSLYAEETDDTERLEELAAMFRLSCTDR